MTNPMRHIGNWLSFLTGGNVCEVCGHSLSTGRRVVCPGCLASLPRTNLHLASPNFLGELLGNAVAPVHMAASWFFYDRNRPAANLIRVAKYNNRPDYIRLLGTLYARELIQEAPDAIRAVDVLLPVPMHPQKELSRGFNQARELAVGLADITGIPIGDNLRLVRPKGTQTHRNVEQRHQNVRGIFEIDYPDELNGLNVMIVDDVITTGATITEAVLTLGRSGARPATISVLSLALRH